MSAHYRATRWGLEVLGRAFFGLRTEGRHWIPKKGGLLIASNHRSVFDPVIVGTAARRELHYLAKEELFRNPFVARVLRAYNAFPVRRGTADRKALTTVIRLLRQGEAVLLFPEGTRNRGPGFLPARPGTGMVAAQAQVPVVPAVVQGSTELLGHAFRKGLNVRFGQPVTVREIPVEPHTGKVAYRALATMIMRAIRKLAGTTGEHRSPGFAERRDAACRKTLRRE